uniref:Uncharacterized protein n=1 Tax=Davidia involucrata TaxID=16924 RepID=A0A5B6ZG49_DAVIN
MEKVGKAMVGRCGGLPLAIILLGGILATKHTFSEWETVNQNLNLYLSNSKGWRGVEEVLAFSYHDLPYQFKQCFLYLGNFPEDKEINAKKLYHMWVAEGIVSSSEEGEETMMDVAERCLVELAQRCMVQVRVKKVWSSITGNGRFKSCRLHDLMRDLCLSKVKEEKFFSIIDFRHGNVEQPVLEDSSSTRKIRRLAIYRPPDEVGKITLALGKEKAQHVRSLLFFYFYGRSSFWEQMITNLKDFKLLRVLNLEELEQIIELPEAIGKLIHLRYLSLRYSDFNKLPSSIGNLGYLQTLDLRVSNQYLRIPNVLWKMEQLRHLYLPYFDIEGVDYKLRLDGLSNLETLTVFKSRYCDFKDLLKLTNLRKLKAAIDNKEQLGDFVMADITTKNRQWCSFLYIECSFCSEEELTLLRRVLGRAAIIFANCI